MLNKRLCFKCLGGGHFKDRCPKETFKCQVQGCVEDHNTLLHPTPPALEENPQQTNTAMGYTSATHRTNQDGQSGGRASVTVATGAGERRVCLGVVPVKVRAKGGGRVERVPTDELQPGDRPVWYLPHHPVTHPLKPEKVRVVFDCAAQFAHTSLNRQLLQGPDLTNNIVGVLTRFRQEFVGLVADIQSMFHQVRVEPRDCDALRFSWWPGGDLSAELTEYRMVKHLFGATSSPSVVNLCLRKQLRWMEVGIQKLQMLSKGTCTWMT